MAYRGWYQVTVAYVAGVISARARLVLIGSALSIIPDLIFHMLIIFCSNLSFVQLMHRKWNLLNVLSCMLFSLYCTHESVVVMQMRR